MIDRNLILSRNVRPRHRHLFKSPHLLIDFRRYPIILLVPILGRALIGQHFPGEVSKAVAQVLLKYAIVDEPSAGLVVLFVIAACSALFVFLSIVVAASLRPPALTLLPLFEHIPFRF